MLYASIVTENRALRTNQVYTYKIKEEMLDKLEIGMRVLIPFGRSNRMLKGIVIDINDSYKGDFQLKYIYKIIDSKALIDKELLTLAIWMSKFYISPYIDSIRAVLPPGDFKKIKLEYKLNKESNEDLSEDESNIYKLIKEGNRSFDKLESLYEKDNIKDILLSLEKKELIRTTFQIETEVSHKEEKYLKVNKEKIKDIDHLISSRAKKQKDTMDYLLNSEEELILAKDLLKKLKISSYIIDELERKELIEVEYRRVYRDPIKKDINKYKKHKLNPEQERAIQEFKASSHKDYLLHGVTGSGKTEVYLQIVEEMLEQGKDSIILVPEISLTPQTVDRFVGRFGDRVAVLHSRLSYGERFDEWTRIKNGDVKIVVGARSAIFAPFSNLGLIVIDEEHETSYKSSMNPKYNAIEVAKKRVELNPGAKLLRGTATPDITSYYEAIKGDIKLLELKERVNRTSMPEISLVDMREELNVGNTSIFSRELYREISLTLERKEQIILFLNRRGFSTFVSCRKCGYVVKCNECEVSMTFHKYSNRCKCHYCGMTKPVPKICPECKSKYIKFFGVGTEQIEEMTRKFFPEARVGRMDLDSVARKGSHEKILEGMKNHKIDILIGTQMIAKGLDFANVTLVGVITADTSLNLPDYKAGERTFQLITQVAGRAGRADKEGKVIVQTYTPEHYSIEMARDYDYKGFFEKELSLRKEFSYDPYVDIVLITIYGENSDYVYRKSLEIKSVISNSFLLSNLVSEIIGPYSAVLDKIKNNYRYQIIIKSPKKESRNVKEILDSILVKNLKKIDFKLVKFNIDVNPISII